MQLAASANKAVAKISKLRKEKKRKDSQDLILDSSPSDMTDMDGVAHLSLGDLGFQQRFLQEYHAPPLP